MIDSGMPYADPFKAQVSSRFGVLPNFFCTAPNAPGLIEELWGFARSAYLDSPLPSVFKERLFVHLSRFCEIRYCIVRHVGFLVGEGRPAGDASVRPESIEQAIALLSRPVPGVQQLEQSLALLESTPSPIPIPVPRSEYEGALFDALTLIFLQPRASGRARLAVAHALGEPTFEMLVAFLAFVRTAHYWTETHPTIGYESDMVELMQHHPQLGRLLLDTSEAEWAHSAQALRRALDDLRSTSGALRSIEERFQALVMATSDVLYRMSPDWKEMRALQGRGFLADTIEPDLGWMARYIPEDEQPNVRAAIQRALPLKEVFELEHRILRQDGAVGWVLSRAVPIVDESGEIIEWFGAAMDLTARKNAEEELRRADRGKDDFLATLSHELRNPLAALRNGLEIAKRSNPAADPPLARSLEMMGRQLNMLTHLVDDLLDVSRINTGKILLRREPVQLRAVLASSVEASHSAIDARGHKLTVQITEEDLMVSGDADRLIQAFSNLLFNAAKYTDASGTIELRAGREADHAVISIADSGIGIPKEALEEIFNIFSQVSTHEVRADGGLGIGLALVQQLVALHEGSVQADSPGLGQGSTFTVRLPLISS